MKILLVSTSSGSRGGGELGLLYLGRALALRGNEITLWVSSHPRMNELAESFAAFARVVRSDYLNTYDRRGRSFASYFDRATARRVAAEWRALQPDVLHLNKQNLEDGLDLLHAATLSGLPCITMIHITQSAGYLRARFAGLRDAIARRSLQRSRGLLVTAPESRRQDLLNFVGSSRDVRVVLNGVPIPDLAELQTMRAATRAKLGLRPEEIVFLGVGRMVPQKRPQIFLEQAEAICRAWPEARVLWIGDGPETALWDARVAANGLGARIQRLPWQADASPFWAAADVFLHTAEFEGLSFAVLEALAAGLPCALTPNLLGELPFLDAGNSVAVETGQPWFEPLRNPTVRRQLGEAARALTEERFSFVQMAAAYEALYREEVARTH